MPLSVVGTSVMPAPSGSEPISMLPVPGFDCGALALAGLAITRFVAFVLSDAVLPVAVLLFEAGEQAAKVNRMKAAKASSARRVMVMQILLCVNRPAEIIIACLRRAKPTAGF